MKLAIAIAFAGAFLLAAENDLSQGISLNDQPANAGNQPQAVLITGSVKTAADAYREQVVTTSSEMSPVLAIRVPAASGGTKEIRAMKGRGTVPAVACTVTPIGGSYRYAYKISNADIKSGTYQSISGIKFPGGIAEGETGIVSIPPRWRTPLKPVFLQWLTDTDPLKPGESLDGFVAESKLGPGLVRALILAPVSDPEGVDWHEVNLNALVEPGGALSDENLFNTVLTLGPAVEMTFGGILAHIQNVAGYPEIDAKQRSMLAAISGHSILQAEEDLTVFQQQELRPLIREWAAGVSQMLRTVPRPIALPAANAPRGAKDK